MSTTGNDGNPGTLAAPWRTLAKVNATTLQPGATVFLRRGDTFTGTSLVLDNSGTASAPITLTAYGSGDRPVIDGGGTATTKGQRTPISVTGNYVTVDSVRAQHSDWAGIDVHGNYVTIKGSYLTESVNGVQVNDEAVRTIVRDNEFVNNSVLYIGPGDNDDTGAQGIAVGGSNTEVAYNSFSNHFTTGSPDYGTDGAAIEVYGGRNGNYHHNRSSNDLILAEIGDDASDGNTFHHNVMWSSRGYAGGINVHGSGEFGGVTGTKVLQNTIVLTASDSVAIAADGDIEIRNNVLVAATAYSTGPTKEGGNVWNISRGTNLAGPTSTTAGARLVAPASVNFRLGAGSPAIDRAVPTSVTFAADYYGNPAVGAAWDSGAIEVGS